MTSSEIEIHELLRARRSGRVYDASRSVSDQDLVALLEAARWAPSGGNGQPWRFVVGRKGEPAYDMVFGLLLDFNRTWAQHAPMLLLTVAQMVRTASDGKKVHSSSALHDTGLANMSIVVEATHRGLIARMMGGFDRAAAKSLLDAEANGLEPVTVMALGYPGDVNQAPDDVRQREAAPRTRKPVGELLIELA
jgi:nitroreductase